jgi:hypothetical protein
VGKSQTRTFHTFHCPGTTASVGWRHFVITGNNPVSTTPGDWVVRGRRVGRGRSGGAAIGSRSRIGYDNTNSKRTRSKSVLFHNRRLTSNEVTQLYFDRLMFRPPDSAVSAVTLVTYSWLHL